MSPSDQCSEEIKKIPAYNQNKFEFSTKCAQTPLRAATFLNFTLKLSKMCLENLKTGPDRSRMHFKLNN